MMQAAIDKTQENVNGDVKLKLYKGNVTVVGRTSPNSLYSPAHSTFEEDEVYNQKDAEGFIRLNALRFIIEGQNQPNRVKKYISKEVEEKCEDTKEPKSFKEKLKQFLGIDE